MNWIDAAAPTHTKRTLADPVCLWIMCCGDLMARRWTIGLAEQVCGGADSRRDARSVHQLGHGHWDEGEGMAHAVG